MGAATSFFPCMSDGDAAPLLDPEAQRRLEALLRGGHFSRHRHTNSRSIDITAGRDRVVLKLCNDATAVEWSVLPPHPAAAAVALPSVAGPKRGNVDLAAVAAVVPTGEAGLVILGDSGTKLLEVDAESVETRDQWVLGLREVVERNQVWIEDTDASVLTADPSEDEAGDRPTTETPKPWRPAAKEKHDLLLAGEAAGIAAVERMAFVS